MLLLYQHVSHANRSLEIPLFRVISQPKLTNIFVPTEKMRVKGTGPSGEGRGIKAAGELEGSGGVAEHSSNLECEILKTARQSGISAGLDHF